MTGKAQATLAIAAMTVGPPLALGVYASFHPPYGFKAFSLGLTSAFVQYTLLLALGLFAPSAAGIFVYGEMKDRSRSVCSRTPMIAGWAAGLIVLFLGGVLMRQLEKTPAIRQYEAIQQRNAEEEQEDVSAATMAIPPAARSEAIPAGVSRPASTDQMLIDKLTPEFIAAIGREDGARGRGAPPAPAPRERRLTLDELTPEAIAAIGKK